MTAFLAWVFAQASKVYAFFGDAFTALYNGAANAWNWAVGQAAAALSAARNYAYSLLQIAIGKINDASSWLISQINSVAAGLTEDIRGLFDWVDYRISNISGFVSGLIGNAIDGVNNFITSVRDFLTAVIDNSVAWLQDQIYSAFGWLLAIKIGITNIVMSLTGDRLSVLISMLTTWKATLVSFLNDPIGFIFDMIQEKFISFLCYVLAWGLGTTKYDLPKEPPWKTR